MIDAAASMGGSPFHDMNAGAARSLIVANYTRLTISNIIVSPLMIQ
ncbi:MAG: hypothetical protein QM766_15170 [Burkholderiaceae bacterium]